MSVFDLCYLWRVTLPWLRAKLGHAVEHHRDSARYGYEADSAPRD